MQEVNVKVAIRVRPLLQKEKLANESACVRVIPSTNQLVVGKDRAFTFDHVLASKVFQEDVYDKCVKPLVRSCFDGYNATVFAYGQTGSGKTYTIGGGNLSSQTEDEFGVIPRAVKDMFTIMEGMSDREFCVRVSYIEVYKEELRDLLDMETTSKDLHLREDERGNTVLIGTQEVECESVEEVMHLLEQGSSYRHTASTQMNDHSSRSHSIFTVFIEQKWTDGEDEGGVRERKRSVREEDDENMSLTGKANLFHPNTYKDIEHYMCAKFHFVDLAGSERAHRTGNVGDRFKESVHINSGLLALGNVISALGDVKKKSTHIPYRESKITRLLKDSLGGNSQTLMICCISPSTANFDESLNALKYANRAKNIKNKPIVNRDPQSIRFEEMQCEIKALREELHKQRTSLMTANNPEHDLKRVIEDAGQIKHMEDKVTRLQTECDHYRMIAEEAYRQLLEIRDRDILSQSLNIRLRDWLELMEEIKNKVPATLNKDAWENQTIDRLEKELSQCRNDLKNDEDIFAEKSKEASHMQEQLSNLERLNSSLCKEVDELKERLSLQAEQLVDKQMKVSTLEARLKTLESTDMDLPTGFETPNVSGPPTTNRRAKSVPAHMLGNRSARREDTARNIHTSPAIFSLDRVMQGFRARSQLLVSRLEDNDEVQQQLFSDDEIIEEEDEDVFHREKPKSAKPQTPFLRNTKDRGTYKVSKPRSRVLPSSEEDENFLRQSQTDDEKLSRQKGSNVKFGSTHTLNKDTQNILSINRSAEIQRKKLRHHEIEVRQSTQKMRDLSINIKMKEQLIRELVKSSKDAKTMNDQYKDKIRALEKDKDSARQELTNLQKTFQEVMTKEHQDKEKLQGEFRKKMDTAKMKITTIQKKQKDTEKLASITGQNDKRIGDLELAVDKMRNQQEQLQRKLKEEVDHKAKLEREMEKEQKKIKELEAKNEQQKKVLKIKTEEVTAMQRKIRSGNQLTPNRLNNKPGVNSAVSPREDQSRIEDQKKYLDQELEKVLEQRKCMEDLENELSRREDIVAKKEAMLAERSELEIKRLRSSQVLNKDIMTVTSKLQSVEHKIGEKSRELDGAMSKDHQVRVKEELHRLTQGREKLLKQRGVLDTKLQDGSLLNPSEERRLIELDEAVDALDAAIEYKNESIRTKREEIRNSTVLNQSDNLLSRLSSLSTVEVRTLLTKYFDKVIDLREDDRKKQLQCSELEMKLDEQERVSHELETRLQRQSIEMDRRLTQQQQQYEKKMQVLMQQIAQAGETGGSSRVGSAASERGGSSAERDARILQLEKDLYYYKKTSRDLKKKLREVLSGHLSAVNGDGQDSVYSSRESMTSNKPSSPQPPTSHHVHQSTPREAGEPHPPSSLPEWDRLGSGVRNEGGGAAPVRISRRDLRRMSEEEVQLRKSACIEPGDGGLPTDSLEVGGGGGGGKSKNPWT